MKTKELVKKYFNYIIFLLLITVLSSFISIVLPYVLGNVFLSDDQSFEISYLYTYLLLLVSGAFLEIISSWIKLNFAKRFKVKETVNLYRMMYRMNYESILAKQPTYIINRIHDAVDNFFKLISTFLVSILDGYMTTSVIILIVFFFSPTLSFMYLLYAIFNYFGYKFINKKLIKKSSYVQDVVANSYKNQINFMGNVDYLKQLSSFDFVERYIQKFIYKGVEANASIGYYAEKISVLLNVLLTALQSLIYFYIIFLFSQNAISLSNMTFLILLNQVYSVSLKNITIVNIALRDAKASFKFINEDIIPNFDIDTGQVILDHIDSISLAINNISFGDNILLESGNMFLKKAQVIAIVGESGAGKTTLIKNIIGLLNQGTEIKVNGFRLQELDKSSYKKHILYITQTPSIFPISIKENMTFGMDENSLKCMTIEEITKIKGFEKFLNLDKGLDTIVLEGASNLSGGDRQKIAIARALISCVDVLILDEFSNSIDKETSLNLIELIKEQYKDKIIVLISHESSIISQVDVIYRIKEKKVIEEL